VKSFAPGVVVSIGAPSATDPEQPARPLPPASSAQSYSAETTCPTPNVAPSAGLVMEIVGAVPSTTE
jgi:hypothetical protein